MKRLLTSIGFCMALVLCISSSASAQTVTDKVVEALKAGPVYVDPGTEGTDANTAAGLQSKLNAGDNIFLVMLPASAASNLDGDANAFAKRISDSFGGKKLIGLTVGRTAVGYAPKMPTGVSADLMHRAESVSTNSVETLGTYIRNVHIWQGEHPEAATTVDQQDEADNSDLLLPFGIGFGTVLLGGSLAWVINRRNKLARSEERKHFEAPKQVADRLERIAQLRPQLADADFQSTLFQICTDIEQYFKKSSGNRSGDAATFVEHLRGVIVVLEKYIEVQNGRRYFNDPDGTMSHGKQSICDFGEYVIKSIRRGNDADLLDFSVDTNILAAKKRAVR